MVTYNYITKNYYIGFISSIREKIDIIRLVLNISKFISSGAMKKTTCWSIMDGYTNITFCIDKMRRIFVESNLSVHSFHFPFSIKEDGDKVTLFFNSTEIDLNIISLLTQVFDEYSENNSILSITEKIWDLEIEECISESEIEFIEIISNFLLSFEAGYVRFDVDELRADEINHPKFHLDFNYHTNATYKLGLRKYLDYKDFVSLLNIKSECIYIDY